MNWPATIALIVLSAFLGGYVCWVYKSSDCPPPSTETLTIHVPDTRAADSLQKIVDVLRVKAKADSIAYAESKTAPKYRPGMFKDSTTLRKLGFIQKGQ